MNELLATPTRKRRAADIASLICLLAAIGMALIFVVPLYRIGTNPATTTGMVSEKRLIDGGDLVTYSLKYTFQVAGRVYGGSVSVDRRAYDKALVGDPVSVEYAVDDPGTSRASNAGVLFWHLEYLYYVVFLLGCFIYIGPRRWLKVRRGEADPALKW